MTKHSLFSFAFLELAKKNIFSSRFLCIYTMKEKICIYCVAQSQIEKLRIWVHLQGRVKVPGEYSEERWVEWMDNGRNKGFYFWGLIWSTDCVVWVCVCVCSFWILWGGAKGQWEGKNIDERMEGGINRNRKTWRDVLALFNQSSSRSHVHGICGWW